MKRTLLEEQEAHILCEGFPYVLVRELSRLYLGKAEEADINWAEVTEVRYFDASRELRFFARDNGGMAVVLLEDEAEDETTCQDRVSPLGHNGHFGKQITQREYFGYDADGQLYIEAVRLKDWKG